jgi:hypothetical protein
MARGTNHKPPHYAVFSTLLLPRPSWPQIYIYIYVYIYIYSWMLRANEQAVYILLKLKSNKFNKN